MLGGKKKWHHGLSESPRLPQHLWLPNLAYKHRSDSLDKEIFLHLTVLSFFTKAYIGKLATFSWG